MQIDIKIAIEQNPNLKRYLKENSYWYNYLNRNPIYLKAMEEEMKKKYKLTPEDKFYFNGIRIFKNFKISLALFDNLWYYNDGTCNEF